MAVTPKVISGSQVTIELLLNRVPKNVASMATDMSENASYDVIEHKKLGTNEVEIDNILTGWSGEITLAQRSIALDQLIDAIHLAKRNRIPTSVMITYVKAFDDGSRRHQYLDCEVMFDGEAKRGSAATTKLKWRTGKDRASL